MHMGILSMLICIWGMERQQHQSLYAYSDWHGPHMHMGINDIQIPIYIWGSCQSPYAYGDSSVTNPFAYGRCMHTWIWSPELHKQTFAYGDPWLHTRIYCQKFPKNCIWGSLFANGLCMHMVINIYSSLPANGSRQPAPIWVTPKPVTRQWKKARNVFYNIHGFPDELDIHNHLLHIRDGGVVLHKRCFKAPALDVDNLVFKCKFSEVDHGDQLRTELDLSHLKPKYCTKLTALIKQYWCVSDNSGLFVPVHHYQPLKTKYKYWQNKLFL